MKTKHVILVLSLVIFNSCIVKSLNPFYTKDTIEFTKDFVGEWKDNYNDTWKIVDAKLVISEENKDASEETKKQNDLLSKEYRNSYFVEYKTKKQTSIFLATPFKINNQYFLDFIPFDNEKGNLSRLLKYHIVYTHSLVKLDILDNGNVSIKWFDEKRLKDLFEKQKIKIKHKKIGILKDDILLTATSEELQQFLKKYMVSSSAKKWETETKFTLKKS
ncbi:hypothetical protein [uncultured Tenacibaculum sp.]|uniref:hypothetical protein n=1 Tax=uncultured Tenacibaculum sp. TaxID=174713 RepID=UPI0026038D02|nr:hypothetical protein [uncultured Tenacibaculum sp.]